jgi:hypothetical protein
MKLACMFDMVNAQATDFGATFPVPLLRLRSNALVLTP